MGEVTSSRLEILRKSDAILQYSLGPSDQTFCVLLSDNATGVVDGTRRYGNVICIRAVDTEDYVTASVTPLTHSFLGFVANEIISSVPEVSRVVYDITPKPPGTIEWE